ncbi:MAG: FAD:protein FMN transferase [Deltaproteobacteria bacterium]|nr:FAD:protein FMN transferase [Deltaproteobacteria bacterium]
MKTDTILPDHGSGGKISHRLITAIFLIFFVLLFAGCGFQKEVAFSGKTMGTVYHIKVVAGLFTNTKDLNAQIDMRLDEINKSMSTFRKDSEISRFNALQTVGEKFGISDDFYNVMTVAKTIYEETGGAWDGTVKPLVDLWGFGKSENKHTIPEKSRITALLSEIGFNNIEIDAGHYLVKKNTTITLDLASIAKGYGVDQAAALIRANGIHNFLVEIGGEVFAAGLRKDRKKWRIGINRPRKNAPVDQVYRVVNLQDKGFATSGDYRNYFEVDQKRFSHVIDPRNGYPGDNGVVSVSVIANTCTFADGLATAVMVLGHKKGLDLVNRLDNTECFIVTKKENGALIDHCSKGFKIRK